MSGLNRTDIAVITAGNWMTGTNKQITIPKLGVARVAADCLKGGSHKKPMIWGASRGEFARLHLYVPSDVQPKLWNRAFVISVRTLDFKNNGVYASVLPIFVRHEIDLRLDTLAAAILAALGDGKSHFVGKTLTFGQLDRAVSAPVTAEA
jgi:hypothetical protein